MRKNKISLWKINCIDLAFIIQKITCRNWLNLYEHSELFFLSNNEQSRKVEGRMLIINGYTKEIKKLNNVFFTRIICVFWKTAPKEDKNSQKIARNIIPMI